MGQTLRVSPNASWIIETSDSEHQSYIDRWTWLLALEAGPLDFELGQQLIFGWHTQRGINSKSNAYELSERISNLILFLRFHYPKSSAQALLDPFRELIRNMAKQLSGCLEYHQAQATGNHALNNARAILMASLVLNDRPIRNLGVQILIERLDCLFTADGILREGSSHYQFLICRWLLEIMIVAQEYKDTEIQSIIVKPLKAALDGCLFFIVLDSESKPTIPLIGDISPDVTPDWLLPLPFTSIARSLVKPSFDPIFSSFGGSPIWGELSTKINPPEQRSYKPDNKFTALAQSGYYRLDFEEWTAFFLARDCSGVPVSNHAHDDLCSFVLYWRGCPIIVDLGRHSYAQSDKGSIVQRAASSHNTFTLNGLAPSVPMPLRHIFPGEYTAYTTNVRGEIIVGGFLVDIRHSGFCRLEKELVHSRRFIFCEGKIEIIDSVEGHGCCDYKSAFHFGANISNLDSIGPSAFKLHGKQNAPSFTIHAKSIESDCSITSVKAQSEQSLAYGELASVLSCRFICTLQLPASISYTLKLV